jgi:hypothetical protein
MSQSRRLSALLSTANGLVAIALLLIAVGVESRVRSERGVAQDDVFTAYWVTLFLVANAPIWIVAWRGGLFRNAAT